jgi:hypothetical protein
VVLVAVMAGDGELAGVSVAVLVGVDELLGVPVELLAGVEELMTSLKTPPPHAPHRTAIMTVEAAKGTMRSKTVKAARRFRPNPLLATRFLPPPAGRHRPHFTGCVALVVPEFEQHGFAASSLKGVRLS